MLRAAGTEAFSTTGQVLFSSSSPRHHRQSSQPRRAAALGGRDRSLVSPTVEETRSAFTAQGSIPQARYTLLCEAALLSLLDRRRATRSSSPAALLCRSCSTSSPRPPNPRATHLKSELPAAFVARSSGPRESCCRREGGSQSSQKEVRIRVKQFTYSELNYVVSISN